MDEFCLDGGIRDDNNNGGFAFPGEGSCGVPGLGRTSVPSS
jgi:hypothetical protein